MKKPVQTALLHRDTTLADDTLSTSGRFNVRGQARVFGTIYCAAPMKGPDAGEAAVPNGSPKGYPALIQSTDGVNWDYVKVISLDGDPNQTLYTYNLDERVLGRFVRLLMKQVSGAPVDLRLELYANPDHGSLATPP